VSRIQMSDNRLHVDLVCVTFGTHARDDTWALSSKRRSYVAIAWC